MLAAVTVPANMADLLAHAAIDGGVRRVLLGAQPLQQALDRPVPDLETGWNWCDRCLCLFFGPLVVQSQCAAGGAHRPPVAGSPTYGVLVAATRWPSARRSAR